MKCTASESTKYLKELLDILEEGSTHYEYDVDTFVDDVRNHAWEIKDRESLLNFQVALVKFIKMDDFFNNCGHVIIVVGLFEWAIKYFWR